MAQNKLSDLNDFLMAQIEVLSNENLTGQELKDEVMRGNAIAKLSGNVIKNAKVVFDAAKYAGEGKISIDNIPKTFELKSNG